MENVGRDGVVGYTVPVGRLRWLMREFANAGVVVDGYRVSGNVATVSVNSDDKELADVVAGDVAGYERRKSGKRGMLKGGPLGPALIVFAVAVSFVQPALGLTAGVLGVGGTFVMRKLADNEERKIAAMHAAGLDWTIGQRVENFVTGGLVGGAVIFTIAGLILFALSVYGFDSIGLLDGAIGAVSSWRGGL